MELSKTTAQVDKSVNEDPFYSQANQAYIMKSIEEIKGGKGKVHELIEE